jgi:hypothetical protein
MNVSKTAKDAKIGKESVMKSNHISPSAEKPYIFNKGCQTPLINSVYRSRMIGMEKLTSSIALSYQQLYPLNTIGPLQYLILGAGYDKIENKKEVGTRIYYVDYEDVMNERRRLCHQSEDEDTVLISCDIRNTALLFHLLKENGFNATAPAIVICESVLAYLEKTSVQALLTSISTTISHSCLVIYDPILSHPCGENLLQTFAARKVPLQSAMNSTLEMVFFLRNCSFHHIHSLNIQQFLHSISSSSLSLLHSPISEPFDEFAELVALNQLYAFTYCTNSLDLFNQISQNLFIWHEPREASPPDHLLSRWNRLRYELVKNRLQSYEMKFQPSTVPYYSSTPLPPPSRHPPPRSSAKSEEMRPNETAGKGKQKQPKRSVQSPGAGVGGNLSRTLLSPADRRGNRSDKMIELFGCVERIYPLFFSSARVVRFGYVIRAATPNDLKNIVLLFSDVHSNFLLPPCALASPLSPVQLLLFHRAIVSTLKSINQYALM